MSLSPAALHAALQREGAGFIAELGRWQTAVGRVRSLGVEDRHSFEQAARRTLEQPPRALPLLGAALGFVSYEAGSWFEQMPERAPGPMGWAWLGEVTDVAILDRRTGRWQASFELPIAPEPMELAPSGLTRDPPNTGAAYVAGVRHILGHLRAGDCYQVNLARRIVIEPEVDALTAWQRISGANPARRAMLLHLPQGDLVSNSPELLLEVAGRKVRSTPIKGTAPRSAPPTTLLRSPKERAELTMIVDLVRADLARVCAPGSVEAGPRRVGAVGHVWHAMQEVRGTLAPERDAMDAFAAVFPPGSVTGAPKVRAMEVIHALEPTPRGVYCGAMGWFAPGGSARWNVAIRTIQLPVGAPAEVHVGAGIVLGSAPRREYQETRLKARRMLQALS